MSSEPKDVPYVTQPEQRRKIKLGENGVTAMPPITIPQKFKEVCEKWAGNPTKFAFAEEDDKGEYQGTTFAQYQNAVNKAAKSMLKLGLERFHGVTCLGFNSPEWFIVEMATIHAGGIIAGIYTTNNPSACQYVAHNCKAQIAFVENTMQLKKFLEVWDQLPDLKTIVQYKGKVAEPRDNVYDWEQFMALGHDLPDQAVEEIVASTTPENCCGLIYTSGTTGNPKGVMISHDNMTWTASAIAKWVKIEPSDRIISFLPLSHVAAQMVDVVAPLMAGGATVYFARPDALKGSLGETLKKVRPTVFLAVPRVWTKIYEKMQQLGKETHGVKKTLATWAKSKGLEGGYAEQSGGSKGLGYTIANKIVFHTIQNKLGLDECKFMATAAAPIEKKVLDYFLSLGMPIYEIYGASETTGPLTVSIPGHYHTGTAGPVFDGCSAKIDNPDKDGNGEILASGRHIFMGYLFNEEASQKTIDAEGWYHSGDVGRFTKFEGDGWEYLSITGRIKELIITEGGENVAPVLIEEQITKHAPYLSSVMVIGDRRKYLTCLVTLKVQVDLQADGAPTEDLEPSILDDIKAMGSDAKTVSEAIADEKVNATIQSAIQEANKNAISKAQHVQKFKILKKDFSVPGGELTPTLKLKRSVVANQYAKEIDDMYA